MRFLLGRFERELENMSWMLNVVVTHTSSSKASFKSSTPFLRSGMCGQLSGLSDLDEFRA